MTGLFPIEVFLVNVYHESFIEIPKLNANSVDPDQTPRSAAPDLGLHCLQMFFLWGNRHKWFNALSTFNEGLGFTNRI